MDFWTLILYLILWEISKIFLYYLQLPQRLISFFFRTIIKIPIETKINTNQPQGIVKEQNKGETNNGIDQTEGKDGKEEILDGIKIKNEGTQLSIIGISNNSIIAVPSNWDKCSPEIRTKTLTLIMVERMVDSILPIVGALLK